MNDPLEILWAAFDTPEPVFTAEMVQAWPAGFFEQLIAMHLLVAGPTASHIICPNCDQRHIEEVVADVSTEGMTRFFISCPETMKVEIAPALLHQWQPDFKMLARRAKDVLGIKGRATEHSPNRLLRLGTLAWKQRPREAFMARGLIWPDAAMVAAGFTGKSRPVVFVGSILPPDGIWPALVPAVLSLPAVISLTNGGLDLDHLLLHRLIDEADDAANQKRSIEERQMRQQIRGVVDRHLAEGGTQQLVEGVARMTSTSSEGAAEMAKRGAPMHRTTFARKKKRLLERNGLVSRDSSASILRTPSSQPRDNKGRPLPNAQPQEEE